MLVSPVFSPRAYRAVLSAGVVAAVAERRGRVEAVQDASVQPWQQAR